MLTRLSSSPWFPYLAVLVIALLAYIGQPYAQPLLEGWLSALESAVARLPFEYKMAGFILGFVLLVLTYSARISNFLRIER